MYFFKSVFADDPDPEPHGSVDQSSEMEEKDAVDNDSYPDSSTDAQTSNPNPISPIDAGGWSFGGLIKTISTKSESVIETYRRDLKEFGSGLKKETETFREVASRAVKELPTSIESSASAAQGSLETVGQAIDQFGSSVWKGTSQIISHSKDTLLPFDNETESSDSQNYSSQSHNSKHYNRFDTRVRAIQSDLSTYCKEPDDLDHYNKWKLGFVLEEKVEEVEKLFQDNGTMEEIYKRVVPNEVDRDTFWGRYFYKVNKLKQAEDARVNLVKRAISREEEDLSWDVDDDDDDDYEETPKADLGGEGSGDIVKEENPSIDKSKVASSGVVENEPKSNADNGGGEIEVSKTVDSSEKELQNVKEESKVGSSVGVDGKGENKSSVEDEDKGSHNVSTENMQPEPASEMTHDKSESLKTDEKTVLEGKVDPGESSKDNDFTVVSSQPSLPEEEDMGWDEIEDLGSNDEKKVTHGGSPNRAELRKRLSTADEDEDLSWDIEDDD